MRKLILAGLFIGVSAFAELKLSCVPVSYCENGTYQVRVIAKRGRFEVKLPTDKLIAFRLPDDCCSVQNESRDLTNIKFRTNPQGEVFVSGNLSKKNVQSGSANVTISKILDFTGAYLPARSRNVCESKVDYPDLAMVMAYFNLSEGDRDYYGSRVPICTGNEGRGKRLTADLNKDGRIGQEDYQTVKTAFETNANRCKDVSCNITFTINVRAR